MAEQENLPEQESLLGKEVTVNFEVTSVVAWKGVVVADDEKGITIRRGYRKGVRLELIPRRDIKGVSCEVELGPRRKLGASRATTPGVESMQEPETVFDDSAGLDDDGDGFDGEEEGFEKEPDTEWEND